MPCERVPFRALLCFFLALQRVARMKLPKTRPYRFSKSAMPAVIALSFEDFLALTDGTTPPATTMGKFAIHARGRSFPDRTGATFRGRMKR